MDSLLIQEAFDTAVQATIILANRFKIAKDNRENTDSIMEGLRKNREEIKSLYEAASKDSSFTQEDLAVYRAALDLLNTATKN